MTLGSEDARQYRQGFETAVAARHALPQPPAHADLAPGWRDGHDDGSRAEHAALVLAAVALRLLTACGHGEDQPGTCPECEPLEPPAYVAMRALALLCPGAAAEDPGALREALRLAEALAGAHDHRTLGKVAAALRTVTAA
jgi:hypothetical protein